MGMKVYRKFKVLIKFIMLCGVSCLPRRKNVWVFGSWFGLKYADNSKYLFEYINAEKLAVDVVWITKSKELNKKLQSQGIKSYYHHSFKGLYYQSIASIVFVSHSITTDLTSQLISFKTKRFHLYHGLPLKKVGLDRVSNTEKLPEFKTIVKKLLSNEFYDAIVSTGKKCTDVYSTSLGMPLSNIYETGFPRNDVFNKKVLVESASLSECFKAIYMPTFRNEPGSELVLLDSFDFLSVNHMLSLNDLRLDLKLHPVNMPSEDVLSVVEKLTNIDFLFVDDIYDVINDYDCLITDFSSVMFDFALSNKPVLFAPFHMAEYIKNDRTLNFDYEHVSGGNYFNKWDDVISELLILKNMSCSVPNNTLLEFHRELVGNENFSENVFKVACKLIGFSDIHQHE
ncbi:CDP-glycerol glycerophosphotransferase family protein [Pseudomonadales bacterium]|nr:CDP-glycerol glycerophosphotransferase family protein [Pseudomonadales bacterium]